MTLHALEDLDDAVSAIRSLLTPIDAGLWLKLSIATFFIGGPAGNLAANTVNTAQGNGRIPIYPPVPGVSGGLPRIEAIVGVLVGLVVLVGLGFVLVGSIMEFVFVESLRTSRVRVRATWRERWGQGVRLFGFRLFLGLLVTASVVGVGAFLLSPIVRGPTGSGLSFALIALLLPVVSVVGLVVVLVSAFTTRFVVPVMLLDDCGVLAGWRSLWSSIRAQPWQYAAYALVAALLSVATSIVVGIVMIVPAFVLLLPVAPLALIGVAVVGGAPVLAAVLLAVAAGGYLAGLLAATAVVQVPVIGFIRYYAMLVLGDIDPSLDPIPEVRAAVRDGETG